MSTHDLRRQDRRARRILHSVNPIAWPLVVAMSDILGLYEDDSQQPDPRRAVVAHRHQCRPERKGPMEKPARSSTRLSTRPRTRQKTQRSREAGEADPLRQAWRAARARALADARPLAERWTRAVRARLTRGHVREWARLWLASQISDSVRSADERRKRFVGIAKPVEFYRICADRYRHVYKTRRCWARSEGDRHAAAAGLLYFEAQSRGGAVW